LKLLREPLVQFFFIGIFIYLLYAVFAEPVVEETDKTIVVSTGELEWMNASWQKRWNRPPTAEELNGLVQQYIKETVLYREALTMGLNQHDTVIRRRLAQKMEFLARDLVALTQPSEEELLAYFNEHIRFYQEPVRYTFTQVFIDPDKHGDDTPATVDEIKATLIAKGDAIEDAGELGDDLMLQNDYQENDKADIRRLFGSGFADSLVELSAGQWHGPVLSGYGVHLVYVHSIIEPPAAVFAELRERVTLDWETARGIELNEQFYNSLRDRYTIIIEQPADEKTTDKTTVDDEKLSTMQEKKS
jgi:hypothetical protein